MPPKTIPFSAAPKTIPFNTPQPSASITPTPSTPLAPNPTGATFPSTGNEGLLSGSLKLLGNFPSSAVNFAKGVFQSINPLNTLQNLSQIPSEFHSLVQESGGVKNALEATAKELLPTAYGQLVPKATQQIISGDFQGARATIQNDPIGQILPYILVGKAAAEKAGVGPQFDQAISTMASPVTKTASYVGNTAANVAAGTTKFLSSQLTGLSPNTIQKIVTDPQAFSQEARASITRPALASDISTAIDQRQSALSDTGASYQGIRTQTTPIQVDPSYLDNLIKETTGLTVTDGKLQSSGASSIRLPSDVNALQTKLYNTWAPEFAKGYLTPDEFLNFRTDLSKMVYNDSGIGKSGTLANLSEIMRAKANADLRPQIPGLQEADAQFAPQITELKQLSQGLTDKNGNLTDAAINKIANATGKGKDPLLARLEQLSPGITDKIKILKAVEDLANSRENKPGTYLRAGALGAGIFTLNPYLIVSAIASLPEVAVPLLRGMGYANETISSVVKTLGVPNALKTINNLPNGLPPILNKDVNAIMRENDIQPGLSMKADTSKGVSPLTVAQKIGGKDIPLIQNYVNDPSVHNLLQLQPLIEPMGLQSLDPSLLQRFFQDVIKERNAPDFKPTPVFKQDAATGKMQGKK